MIDKEGAELVEDFGSVLIFGINTVVDFFVVVDQFSPVKWEVFLGQDVISDDFVRV